jgi:arginase
VSRKFGCLGVPSSAGARTPGQEKGPAAVRAAGLLELLIQNGLDVRDHGDLPVFRWRPDSTTRSPQNLAAVVSTATLVAETIEEMVRAGELPLVVGGDCTITVGVVTGMLRAGLDPSLLYIDGGVDLYVPATQPGGHMDSMGVAHLIGEPGSAPDLAGLGPTTPMLEAGKVMFFGQSAVSVRPSEDLGDVEGLVFSRHGFRSYPIEVVTGRAAEAAAEARRAIEFDDGPFLAHFDVDVLDFLDCPLADQPEDRGLLLDEAMESLGVFAGSSQFGGIVLTEINPDHADGDGTSLRRFVEGVAGALAR